MLTCIEKRCIFVTTSEANITHNANKFKLGKVAVKVLRNPGEAS